MKKQQHCTYIHKNVNIDFKQDKMYSTREDNLHYTKLGA
jgi:hypothetical protein